MDLSQLKEVFDLVAAIMIPLTAIVVSIYVWRRTGEIDLGKTLGHVEDVVHIVVDAISSGTDEDKAIAKGVEEVEKLRMKKLGPKLKGKASARIKARLTERLKDLGPQE